MTVLLRLVILFSLYLFLPLGVRTEFCEVIGDLREVKVCSFCLFKHTFQVCTSLDGSDQEWRHVCYREPWDLDLVDVYCRQNGYSGRKPDFIPTCTIFSYGDGVDKLNDIECNGSESNLTECTYGITNGECKYPLYDPYSDCEFEDNNTTSTTESTAVTTESTAGTTESTAVTTESTAGTTESTAVTTGSTHGETTSTPFNGRNRETDTTTISERNRVTDSETTSYPVNVRDISPVVTTPSDSTNGASSSSLFILLSILVGSVLCGSLIIVVTVIVTCFLCMIRLRNSQVKVNPPAVDYETPNLVFQNNLQCSTSSFVTSPISESHTQLDRSITSYEIPRIIPSPQPIIYQEVGESQDSVFYQSMSSYSYNYSLEENSIYGYLVEGEIGNSVLYEQCHRINCRKFNTVASLQSENSSENEYYTMQERIIYIEPPTSLPQLESVFNHCFNEIERRDIEMGEEFASGQFGVVYRAVYHTEKGDIPIAIKTLKEAANSDMKVAFMREAAILAQFQHPNVLRMIGVLTTQQPYMMVTELLKTELAELLLKFKALHTLNNTDGSVSVHKLNLPPLLLKFSQEISAGMEHLSEKHFIHRDLAARNVLVAKDLSCRIADFGMSRELNSDSEYYTSSGGRIPLRWTAPEAVFYQKYSEKSDVWSFGMTLFEIWSLGDKPWGNDATNEVIVESLSVGTKLSPPTGCPRDVYSIMMDTWIMDPSSRPTFSRILRQFTNIQPHDVSLNN